MLINLNRITLSLLNVKKDHRRISRIIYAAKGEIKRHFTELVSFILSYSHKLYFYSFQIQGQCYNFEQFIHSRICRTSSQVIVFHQHGYDITININRFYMKIFLPQSFSGKQSYAFSSGHTAAHQHGVAFHSRVELSSTIRQSKRGDLRQSQIWFGCSCEFFSILRDHIDP